VKLPRFYGINGAPNPAYGAVCACLLAAYKCRDANKTSVTGVKTWERFPRAVQDAARKADPNAPVESLISNFCRLIAAPCIHPKVLARVVQPSPDVPVFFYALGGQSVGEAIAPDQLPEGFGYLRDQDGQQVDEFQQTNAARELALGNFAVICADACQRMGIDPGELVRICLEQPEAITSFVRLAIEERKALGEKDEPIEQAIEVEVTANG
jgi:hypothetical protein